MFLGIKNVELGGSDRLGKVIRLKLGSSAKLLPPKWDLDLYLLLLTVSNPSTLKRYY